jgi:hypothetical protein
MWSKRSHGDIYALVQVSQNMRDRGADVRAAISQTLPPDLSTNIMLNRAAGFVLTCFANIVAEFGIQTNGRAQTIFDKYKAMQERDEESGALKIRATTA